MQSRKSKFGWCLASEKRMKRVAPQNKLSKEHIEKAKHNLKAADYNVEGGFSDWADLGRDLESQGLGHLLEGIKV